MIKKILIVAILLFGAYLFLYQNIINERVKLEDEHCIVVNPLIIKRKELYLDSMRALVSKTGGLKAYQDINNQYIEASKKYITKEDKWLKEDLSMINNPLVMKLVNKEGYQGALLLHRIYELDFINTKIILKMFKEKDQKEQDRLGKSITENTIELKKANNDYDKISSVHNYRLVDRLIKVPPSKCPPENRNIPDVEKELEKIMVPGSLPSGFKEGIPS